MGKTKLTKKNFGEVMATIRREAGDESPPDASNDSRTYVEEFTLALESIVRANKPGAATIVKTIDAMLDGLVSEDFYGTEAQNDPRGDQRD